jgi:curved DNA-binding protein
LRDQYQRYQATGGNQQDFDFQNWSAKPGQDANVHYANAEDLEDLFGSDSPYSEFFKSIFGQGDRGWSGGGRTAQSVPHRGRDVEYEVKLTLEEAYHGAERLLEMDGHRIKAGIPPGVRTGSRVRLASQGEPGYNNGPPGDLYLLIHILTNQTFERAGDDLHLSVPVDIFTAISGGEVRIPAMDRPLILKIPARTNAGQSFRLRGKGMPLLGDPKKHGDLFALVNLVLPDKLTDQEVNSIHEMAEARLSSPERDEKRDET